MMQDHSQAAMRNCHAYASPLFPKACNELPCLAGLLTRLSLSPSHADEPHSGLIMTDLTQTYSSGHCCRFARHSLGQTGHKDTTIPIVKQDSKHLFQQTNITPIIIKRVPTSGTLCKATIQTNKRDSVPLAGRLSFL